MPSAAFAVWKNMTRVSVFHAPRASRNATSAPTAVNRPSISAFVPLRARTPVSRYWTPVDSMYSTKASGCWLGRSAGVVSVASSAAPFAPYCPRGWTVNRWRSPGASRVSGKRYVAVPVRSAGSIQKSENISAWAISVQAPDVFRVCAVSQYVIAPSTCGNVRRTPWQGSPSATAVSAAPDANAGATSSATRRARL